MSTEFFISNRAVSGADGTRERPYPSIAEALGAHGGGHTYTFLPGFYPGPLLVPRPRQGWPDVRTIVRSEHKWAAVVLGSPSHGLLADGAVANVVIDGFEITGSRSYGVQLTGHHIGVQNCWIHGNAHQGLGIQVSEDVEIVRNLIEYNGIHPQFQHGMYLSGERFFVSSNIVRHNSGYGVHLRKYIRESTFSLNLIHSNGRGGLALSSELPSGHNWFISNTLVNDATSFKLPTGDEDRVVNNIVISFSEDPATVNGHALIQSHTTADDGIHAHNNLILRSVGREFVAPGNGVFWLSGTATARNAGSPNHATRRDFWGRRRSDDSTPDLGAFDYVPFLTTDAARAGWSDGWAYRRSPPVAPLSAGQGDSKVMMPDFWAEPQ